MKNKKLFVKISLIILAAVVVCGISFAIVFKVAKKISQAKKVPTKTQQETQVQEEQPGEKTDTQDKEVSGPAQPAIDVNYIPADWEKKDFSYDDGGINFSVRMPSSYNIGFGPVTRNEIASIFFGPGWNRSGIDSYVVISRGYDENYMSSDDSDYLYCKRLKLTGETSGDTRDGVDCNSYFTTANIGGLDFLVDREPYLIGLGNPTYACNTTIMHNGYLIDIRSHGEFLGCRGAVLSNLVEGYRVNNNGDFSDEKLAILKQDAPELWKVLTTLRFN